MQLGSGFAHNYSYGIAFHHECAPSMHPPGISCRKVAQRPQSCKPCIATLHLDNCLSNDPSRAYGSEGTSHGQLLHGHACICALLCKHPCMSRLLHACLRGLVMSAIPKHPRAEGMPLMPHHFSHTTPDACMPSRAPQASSAPITCQLASATEWSSTALTAHQTAPQVPRERPWWQSLLSLTNTSSMSSTMVCATCHTQQPM